MPASSELIDQLRNRGDLGGRIACVQPDCRTLVRWFGTAYGVGNERLEQRRRDVVNAVKPQVFEHVQGNALTGAGQTAEDDDAHAGTLAQLHDARKREALKRGAASKNVALTGGRLVADGPCALRGGASRPVTVRKRVYREARFRAVRWASVAWWVALLFLVFSSRVGRACPPAGQWRDTCFLLVASA